MTSRVDFSNRVLGVLSTVTGAALLVVLIVGRDVPPGSSSAQGAAIVGTFLLLVPVLFSILKRTGRTQSPPMWFVAHVVCSCAGSVLIFFHVAGGSWWTAPGVVLLGLVFLVVQGFAARIMLARSLSYLFASRVSSFNFVELPSVDQARLRETIEAKIALLALLDPSADEALFSPMLKHWFKSPCGTWRYQCLVEQEYGLVGARKEAGSVLQWWRRLHLLIGVLFFAGLAIHMTTVLFFAGYVAGEGDIYWWHFTAWGG